LEDIMVRNTALTLAVALLATTIGAASAQTADEHAAHHPEAAAGASACSHNKGCAPGDVAASGMTGSEMLKGGMGAMMSGGKGQMMGGGMGQMMGGGMMGGATAMAPFSHIEGRIAFLKAELAVTDAQASQWNAFADAYRANAKIMRDSMASMKQADQPANAADRSDAMVNMMSAHVDGMRAVAAAEKALYAVLTDSQRTTADELLGGPMMGIGCPMGGQST
jgi:hypothetical protein